MELDQVTISIHKIPFLQRLALKFLIQSHPNIQKSHGPPGLWLPGLLGLYSDGA